ncbi:MAG: transglutaminase family protein [Burkholderiales bacterium]|nr:MAG: transglutaminase family protein [Burkholderiales bacterium]
MIYDISHLTRYAYAADVPFTRCHLHVLPASRPGQRVIDARLSIDPTPSEQAEHVDFYGNRAHHVSIDVPHRALTLRAHSALEVARPAPPSAGETPAWEAVRDEALGDSAVVAAAGAAPLPVHFMFASRLVRFHPGIADWARASFPPGRPCLEAATELMHRLHAEFEYDPTATDMATPLAEAFANRRGVCQDFAHVLIAALRDVEVPAAYVSGFLRTLPPPGQAQLQGVDATHAWVAVWCGASVGWVGLDPTNDMIVADMHIELALGRDYADVAPVDGVVIAAGGHELSVAVDVVARVAAASAQTEAPERAQAPGREGG